MERSNKKNYQTSPEEASKDSDGPDEKKTFPPETIDALKALGAVLERIDNQLISEGYEYRDGKYYKDGVLCESEEYVQRQRRKRPEPNLKSE